MVALALVGGRAWAAGPAPTAIPLPSTLQDPIHPLPFVQAGAATWNSNTATVTQQSANVQLNWAKFDIGSNATVTFNQPNASSIALNRIWDSNPSQIFGALKANGQVYLLNQNGIVFGPTAQVNVGTLVASALDITPAALSTDIGSASNSGAPAFWPFADAAGNPITSGSITILPGANLQGRQIFLFAPNVTNQGHIETTDGQAILAAGTEIYLIENSEVPGVNNSFAYGNFNGYVVEVKVDNVKDADLQGYLKNQLTAQPGGAVGQNPNATLSSGTVTNGPLGEIIANRGNVSLIGLAVNQRGRVSATSSVLTNGSIRLVAQEVASVAIATGITEGRTGAVSLGTNSVTEVRPDLGDTSTSVAADPQPRSNVYLDGRTVNLDQGAQITATSGDVQLTAHDPQINSNVSPQPPDDSWVYLASGSGIDVSGESVTLPMTSNVLSVQLRKPELQNSPLQTSLLYGKTISVDLRQHGTNANGSPWYGTPLVDLSGDVGLIGSTVAQRSTTGGTVTIDTGGSAIIRAGSDINLSGGVVHYNAGYVNTTQLVSQGTVYDIAKASPDVVYSGFTNTFTVHHAKWGVTQSWNILGGGGSFQNAYNVGMDAGTLTVKGPQLVVDGDVHADTVIGPYQRNSPSALLPGQLVRWQDEVPLGGQFILGDGGAASAQPDYRAPDVVFSADTLLSSQSFNPATDAFPADIAAVNLSPGLMRNGMSRVTVYSNGSIDLPVNVALDLPAGGSLALTASHIALDGAVNDPAGSVSATVTPTAQSVSQPGNLELTMGPNAGIDVRGAWVNDRLATPAASSPALINGGTVSLKNTYGDINLAPGGVIDVSGGGWLQANGKIKSGNGGRISLAVQPIVGGTVTPVALNLGATLRGYALGKGGTLNITANGICVGGQACAGSPFQVLTLATDFFSQGGFSSYKLTSNLDDLTIAGDATLAPRVQNLVLDPSAAAQSTGSDLSGFSYATTLPDVLRSPVNLEFDVAPNSIQSVTNANFNQLGVLTMERGARILAGPGASVSFNSSTRTYIDGTIDAPAGNLNFGLSNGLQSSEEYISSQSLWFGPDARLAAPGTFQPQPNASGLTQGQVLPGGTINIDAQRGYIVAQAGATLDVSGTAALIDMSRLGGAVQPATVASDAGSVNLTAAEGVLFDGALRGQAGGPGAAGGRFTLTLDPNQVLFSPANLAEGLLPFPTNARVVTLNDGAGPNVPGGLAPGNAVPDAVNGQAQVNGAALVPGGFDALTLVSRNLDPSLRIQGAAPATPGKIQLVGATGKLVLALGRRLTLDATTLSLDPNTSQAKVSAPYIALGDQGASALLQPPTTLKPSLGNGILGNDILEFDGQLIDVFGNSVTQNINSVTLNSTGDIRLRGLQQDQGRTLTGSFATAGDMTLQAAQIYPTTLSSFTLQSTGALPGADPGTISFQRNGTPTPVLEAGGQLTVAAPIIDQGGVVKAPLGEIDLNASQNLQLDAGSLTSTSADGQLIPFGQLQGGFAWVYQLNGQTLAFGDTDALPQKRVSLSAPAISVDKNATIDVSGGGDFFAYQFSSGVLSTQDLLSTGLTPNTFAILPGLNPLYAPFDPQEYAASALQPSDSVYLSAGIPGLNPGQYALLPARYALLPGAYLVTAVSGYQDLAAGQRASLTNGVSVVSGYRTVAGTDIRDARTSGFAVQPGSSILAQASYDTQAASQFFTNLAATNGTAVPRLPQDAGVVAINAQQSLALNGNLRAATMGRGAAVDISANQIEVVPQADAGRAGSGVLQLGADRLNAFGAESLLLGATRTDTSAGTELSVGAAQVTLDSGVSLHAPELMLAAKDTINVNTGSQLTATGTLAGIPSKILIGDSTNGVTGNGALLRLSTGPQAGLTRQNYDSTSGTLNIKDGATLKADGSMILDATKDLIFSSSANLIDSGALSVGAGSVSLGDGSASGGFVLSSAAIANLGVTDLALRSYTALNLYGNVSLNLHSLSLETGEIAGHGDNNTQAMLGTSGDLSWSNPNSPYADTPAGQGNLVLHGARVLLGDGTYAARGFSSVTIEADNEIVAQGTTGNLSVAGNLNLSARRVTGAAKADMAITAGDGSGNYFPVTIEDLGQNSPSAPLPAPDLGARLALTGTSISQGGNIDLPSGSLTLMAKGTAGDVVLMSGSQTSVGGSTKSYGGTNVYAPGGDVTLTSDSGNVNVQANAQIDVAGGTNGGDGGTLTVSTSNGTLSLDPNSMLAGGALSGYNGAAVALDVATFDFSSVNSALNKAGFNNGIGFTGARTLRQRRGDIIIGQTVTAQKIELSADTGAIDVSGTLDASGAKGGRVTLNAQNDISLQGATINASATAPGQDGGRVALNTSTAGILLDASSTINVAGGGTDPTTGVTGAGGQVALRLPQASVLSVGGGSGNPQLSLAGMIKGSAQTTIEGFKTYDYSASGQIGSVDTVASTGNPLYADASAFMNQSLNVMAALGSTGGNVQLMPGIEIDSKSDLTLTLPPNSDGTPGTWDFMSWRFNNEAGVLTLRAAGNLNVNNTITDNFVGRNGLQSSPSSWSYRLVAGADLKGASPLALGSAGQGNFTLAAGTPSATAVPTQTAIRTGAADIAVAAAGNIVLGNSASVIYTAGNPYKIPGPSTTSVTDPVTGITTTTAVSYPSLASSLGALRPYPQGKSDITLQALGDIDGAVSNQLFTGWLYRAGRPSGSQKPSATGWTVAFERFQQGIGAFAGGNVDVQAGGNINNLSVSIPTIGVPKTVTTTVQGGTAAPTTSTINQPVILGGGDLQVASGGNIASGIFYTGQGDMTVRAGGSLSSGHSASSADPQPVYTILGLGGGQADITARADLALQTVVNPTLVLQDSNGQTSSAASPSVFSTYAPDSVVRLTAVGGDLTLNNNVTSLADSVSLTYQNHTGDFASTLLAVYPPLLKASALSGSIDVQNSMTMFPAPKGNLVLLANGSVTLEPGAQVVLSDADPNLLPGPSNPAPMYANASGGITDALRSILIAQYSGPQQEHASVPVHADQSQPDGQPDAAPVEVVALTGDVTVKDPNAQTFFDLAKPAVISAGRDVVDLWLAAQNLHAGDETRVSAGRDIVYSNLRDDHGQVGTSLAQIVVDGPGQLIVAAGRNVDLAASNGIFTRGNIENAALPSGGADITVQTGAAGPVDYAGFIQRYFVTGQDYSDQLTTYMQTLTGDSALTSAAALTAFLNLPLSQQQPMVSLALYHELRAAGEAEANSHKTSDYNPGFAAISTLFPSAPANYAGDLTLYFSKIYTFGGGDINFVVPGGSINAGLSAAPETFGGTLANQQLGVVAQSVGSINSYSYGNFQVNASRVFAADGGDIVLWSSTGNIDAGRGSKTALTAPPPSVKFPQGEAVVTFPPALKGSGIREFVTTPGRPTGVVDLFAPAGAVNTGDAGIGSAGNLNIAAQQVIGADNIQVSGLATGVPAANIGGVSASLAGVGNVAAAASKVGDEAAQNLGNQSNDTGFLGVEVMGFGDQ